MIDQDIKQTLKELEEVLNHKAIEKIKSHITSLVQKNIDVTKSRNRWKEKCQ